jgi:hypothetical protein
LGQARKKVQTIMKGVSQVQIRMVEAVRAAIKV